MSKLRLRLLVFFVKIWRAWLWPRLNLPDAVERKRFAAPLCVLSFGIISPYILTTDFADFTDFLIRVIRAICCRFQNLFSGLFRHENGEHLIAFHFRRNF